MIERKLLKSLLVFAAASACGFVSAQTVSLSPTLVGNVISTTSDTQFNVEVSANPDNKPTGAVTIPDKVTVDGKTYTVTEVAESGFSGTDVTLVKLPATVTKINKLAFFSCKSLTGVVEISHGSVKEISMDSFRSTTALESVYFPSVTNIPSDAFYGSGLVSADFPAATFIGARAFYECRSLGSVTLSTEVNTISANAFLSCHELKHVVIGNKLTTIGAGAFMFCYGLEDFVIPANLSTLGEAAFSGCTAIKDVYILNPDYSPSQDKSNLLDIKGIQNLYYVASLKEPLEAFYASKTDVTTPALLPMSSIVKPVVTLIDADGYKFSLDVLNSDVTDLKVSSVDTPNTPLRANGDGLFTSPTSSVVLQYSLSPYRKMWYVENLKALSGMQSIAADSSRADISLSVNGGIVTVNNASASSVEIFDLNGRLVSCAPVSADGSSTIDFSDKCSGAYIIKVGNQSKKFILN